MNYFFKIFCLALILSSCKSGENNILQIDKTSKLNIEKPQNGIQYFRSEPNDDYENNETQTIQFSDLTIVVQKIDMGWDDMFRTGNDSIYFTDKDTAYFDIWPGDWFFDKKFKIEELAFDKIELYEKITYNIAMNSKRDHEVPMCVMSGWKTFESEWNYIKFDNEELKFKSNENNVNPVINFTVEEFKAAVKEHCGIEWFDEIKNIKSLNRLPSELFTTTYIFKIVARNSKTGEVIRKYIVFETPTSC